MNSGNISVFIPHMGCPYACSFCSQRDISSSEKAPSVTEAENIISGAYAHMTDISARENTEIAFFGGSFTAIDREYMTGLLKAAVKYTGKGGFKGIRVSTRPDFIDGEILSLLKKYNVTAIELGAQSMSDRVLEMNRRGHTAADVEKSAELIKRYGFEFGLQMMTGLYGSSPEDDLFTVKRIAEIAPDTVRVYPTAVIDGTYLGELYKSGRYVPYSFAECINVCAEAEIIFHANNIRVIRMGLHAEKSLENKLLGGFYHPAFAELVRTELFGRCFRAHISENAEEAEIYINPRDRSAAGGYKRSNLLFFKERGTKIILTENSEVKRNNFIINNTEYCIYSS